MAITWNNPWTAKAPPNVPAPSTPAAAPLAEPSASLDDAVGLALRLHVQQTGQSVSDLAKRASLTHNTIRNIMSGAGMRLGTLAHLCRAMGWSIEVKSRNGVVIASFTG